MDNTVQSEAPGSYRQQAPSMACAGKTSTCKSFVFKANCKSRTCQSWVFLRSPLGAPQALKKTRPDGLAFYLADYLYIGNAYMQRSLPRLCPVNPEAFAHTPPSTVHKGYRCTGYHPANHNYSKTQSHRPIDADTRCNHTVAERFQWRAIASAARYR